MKEQDDEDEQNESTLLPYGDKKIGSQSIMSTGGAINKLRLLSQELR
jgi:hypothetical protein